ncbi:MAG: hypothetical protein ABSA27_14485 [Terriglobales bacterium]
MSKFRANGRQSRSSSQLSATRSTRDCASIQFLRSPEASNSRPSSSLRAGSPQK